MPFPPRPVDSTLHGVVDYMAGATLTTVLPKLTGVEGTRSARQIRTAGAAHLTYSTMTNYPLGIVKPIPFKAHLALDALGALAVGATPFITGQYKEGRRQWVPHVALCAFELMSLAMTDPTGKGDYHGDVEAIREANQEDPHRKIHEGGPAVKAPNGSAPTVEEAAPAAPAAVGHA
jgi:hypothetical protein